MLVFATLAFGLAQAPDSRAYEGVEAVVGPAEKPPPTAPETEVMPRVLEGERREEAPVPEASTEAGETYRAGAFVDVAYIYNSSHPDNHLYRGATTTPRTGEFTPNLGAAYVLHQPVVGEPWAFELGLQAGPAADALVAAEPVPGGDDGRFAGAEVFKHLALANAGWRFDTGTEVRMGLMNSPLGIGGFWSKDNWTYSPTWASNGTPFYLMGAKLVQELPRGFTLEAWIVNGWQTMADLNEVPSYVVGASWIGSGFEVAQRLYAGPDNPDISARAWRVHSDTFAIYRASKIWVGAVWDVGFERLTREPSAPFALWTGGGLFFKARLFEAERFAVDLNLRPDAWWDRDGIIYGVDQWLISATAGLDIPVLDVLLPRIEYRFDHSTAAEGFFYAGEATSEGSQGLARNQSLVFFSLVGRFERGFSISKLAG